MLVDHANRYLLASDFPWMEQAGRVVFPLFAFVLGFGLCRRGGQDRALFLAALLVVFGAVAHLAAIPLVLAGVRGDALNVLFTLAAGCMMIWGWRHGVLGSAAFMAAGVLSWCSEYGPIGAALVFAFWLGRPWLSWLLLAALSVMQLTLVPLAVLVLVRVAEWLCAGENMRSPRMLFGLGYIVQFAAFSLLLILQV